MTHKGEGSHGQLFNFGEILGEIGGNNVTGNVIGKGGAGNVNSEKRCPGSGGGLGGGCDGARRESISQYLRTSQGSNEQGNGRFFF
jgi:hypothetical protein